nr:hypothetical protein CFP56_64878 [Quercus suber]
MRLLADDVYLAVTAYKDLDQCGSVSGDETYRIWTGSDPVDCVTMSGTSPAGITCGEYQNGGTVGPLDCTDETDDTSNNADFWGSVDVRSDGLNVKLYSSGDCKSFTEFGTDQNACAVYSGEGEPAGFNVS